MQKKEANEDEGGKRERGKENAGFYEKKRRRKEAEYSLG